MDALSFKEEGNKDYKAGNYEDAIIAYTKAIDSTPQETSDKAVFYKNRSACHLKLENYEKSAEDASSAIDIIPGDTKALFRLCQSLEKLGRAEDAYQEARKLVQLDPKNKEIQQMLMRLTVVISEKRKLSARSDRVKGVDLHPSEPWMLVSLHTGNLHVWNYESQTLVKSFEVCHLPVRAARFVARKNWVISGSDDMCIRVFNYRTLSRVHSFEAHSDYIRSIAVHPIQPFILTSSDDMLIKLWDWDNKWQCPQMFEGHSHYVMQIVFNPKNNNTFASASLDKTVKVWQLGSGTPNFTLEGHEEGVNCVDYYSGGDKPYLVSGADDRYVKIWDYQKKTCIQTLEGHAQNVTCVSYNPELSVILTGSEDETVRIWHADTYRLETTLNYGLKRVWAIASHKGSNNVAFGHDEGSIHIKLGREELAMSMDTGGKTMWAKHSKIQQPNLEAITDLPD